MIRVIFIWLYTLICICNANGEYIAFTRNELQSKTEMTSYVKIDRGTTSDTTKIVKDSFITTKHIKHDSKQLKSKR
jgi:hypothetical protein